MKDNIDFKELWNKQVPLSIDADTMIQKVKQFKARALRKLIISNISLGLTALFIGYVWYYFQPEWITTKIGIMLIMVAIALFLLVYNRMIPLLSDDAYPVSSAEYLTRLQELNRKQLFLSTTILNIYFILLSAGIFLYMLEYTTRMNWVWATTTYAVTIFWMALNWFYIRRRSLQKLRSKMGELINQAEALSKQL